MAQINRYYHINHNAEITLEANPDDLSLTKLKTLKAAGINRLSIGIQSFQPAHLQYLNRLHSAQEALDCIENAYQVGFRDFSIDLIYGIPADSHQLWAADLQQAFALPVNHISAYCLTIEPKTVFGHRYQKGLLKPPEEDFISQQFAMLHETVRQNGFEAYEISNFAKPGHYAKHNSNYWCQGAYLGIGPSAHSFDGARTRQYNIANNAKYLRAISEGKIPAEQETLSPTQQANEYIMTSLRTQWGCSLNVLQQKHGVNLYQDQAQYLQKLMKADLLYLEQQTLKLTQKGQLLADEISAELFVI